MSSFRTLNIGMTALFTQKLALDVTGQNIANAMTPGYARQRLVMEANKPQLYSYGAVGTGVGINKLEHLTDNFLESQVRTAMSDMGSLQVALSGYQNIEVYFNELTDNDISSAFDRFWNATQDWNNNVEDISSRRNVASEAETLCDTFQNTRQKIYDYRTQQNLAIRDTVQTINEMTAQIAVLNKSIMKIEAGGATGVIANDLRDQRTELVKQLSGYMDVSVSEEKNGSLVIAQKGRMLVFQDQSFTLETEVVNSNGMLVDNIVFSSDKENLKVTAGKLYGMVHMRDEVALGFLKDVDQLAAEFMWNMNRTHSQGVGLTGHTSMVADYQIIDPNAALDQLKYNFTPQPNTFQIKDGSFELKVYDTSSGQTKTISIDIDLDNVNPDKRTILANTTPTLEGGKWVVKQPENSLIRKMQDALDSVSPNTFKVELDQGNQIKITSNAANQTFAFGRDSSGVLAGLGLNTLFKGYDAQTMSVKQEYVDNPEFLAGAKEFVAGDQSNSIALLQMRSTKVMASGTATFDDYYQGVIGSLGINASRVSSLYQTQTDILMRVENQREDLSGVNLDEEITKMLLYQKSYQAAAKFISTAESLYDALLGMLR